jgi:hypothetical protein
MSREPMQPMMPDFIFLVHPHVLTLLAHDVEKHFGSIKQASKERRRRIKKLRSFARTYSIFL